MNEICKKNGLLWCTKMQDFKQKLYHNPLWLDCFHDSPSYPYRLWLWVVRNIVNKIDKCDSKTFMQIQSIKFLCLFNPINRTWSVKNLINLYNLWLSTVKGQYRVDIFQFFLNILLILMCYCYWEIMRYILSLLKLFWTILQYILFVFIILWYKLTWLTKWNINYNKKAKMCSSLMV